LGFYSDGMASAGFDAFVDKEVGSMVSAAKEAGFYLAAL